jgi:hypothetical protein
MWYSSRVCGFTKPSLAARRERELVGRQHENRQGLAIQRCRKREDLGDGGIAERHRPVRRPHRLARPRAAIGDLVIEHGHRRVPVEVEISLGGAHGVTSRSKDRSRSTASKVSVTTRPLHRGAPTGTM